MLFIEGLGWAVQLGVSCMAKSLSYTSKAFQCTTISQVIGQDHSRVTRAVRSDPRSDPRTCGRAAGRMIINYERAVARTYVRTYVRVRVHVYVYTYVRT